MTKKLHKLLFIILLFNFNAAFADNKVELKTSETSQLDQIHEALEEFTRFDKKNNIIYEQKRREMLDSIETRFHACDPDNDNTLAVYETKPVESLLDIFWESTSSGLISDLNKLIKEEDNTVPTGITNVDISWSEEDDYGTYISNTFEAAGANGQGVGPLSSISISQVVRADSTVVTPQVEIEETDTDEDEIVEIEEDDEEFFMVVENMPEYPGGDLGLMKFIQKNVRYHAIAKEYNITGKVYVSFIVDKQGSVTNVKIVRGVDKNLDAEALRVVSLLPKYKPGKQRGKAVRVMFTIPINFTLN